MSAIQQRRERERARRHQLIVTTARKLAEEEGWEAVTTRRLAERIEYSQPVLYSHFAGKDAIVAAVALEGFDDLATLLNAARDHGRDPRTTLTRLSRAYVAFARDHPAVYDAMFTIAVDLPFDRPDTPAPLRAAFGAFQEAMAAFAGDRAPGTLAEIAWSALHGLIVLSRGGRLPPEDGEERLSMLIDQLART